jgi:hypothetical protein
MKTNILSSLSSLRSKQYLLLFKNGVKIEGFLTLCKIKFDWLNYFGFQPRQLNFVESWKPSLD